MFKPDTLNFYKSILAQEGAEFIEQTSQQKMLIQLRCGHQREAYVSALLQGNFATCKECKRQKTLKATSPAGVN